MNVPTIGQGLGSVATLPGPHSGGETSRRGPVTAAAFARVAWFDLNGDGHIENRNPLEGGDGTLILPANSVDVPTYSRDARRVELRPAHVAPHGKTTDDEPARATHESVASQDVQTQKVIDAYQRYGQPAAVAVA